MKISGSGIKILSKTINGIKAIIICLVTTLDNWSLNVDRGNKNAVVFLDLQDTVDHNILLSKLEYYGIPALTLDWFNSYLNNRTQTCTLNNYTSSKALVRCGVPQGTILGPLLFLIYINDLPNCLTYSQPRMYADDFSITFASNDIYQINKCVNSDLCNIHNWLSANKLVQFIDLFGHNTSIYIKYLKIIKEKMARKPIKKPGGL